MRLYSIGHSTRSLDEFVALLQEHGIRRLADIRRYPASRRYSHFNADALESALKGVDIAYAHFDALGGRRAPSRDSPNQAWRNDQFRGYADHMGTAEFAVAVKQLVGSDRVTAFMCAEAVPWRCHRNLLSDELTRRGIEVLHILGPHSVQLHQLNPAARDTGSHLIYPAPQGTLL
ncbi:MAG TPA: DUF488 domain-containing protein [Thermoanaerobaculia bacterium]|nr:DUF488 domain-containing protein [Thermoanaerobaculia bacterium]